MNIWCHSSRFVSFRFAGRMMMTRKARPDGARQDTQLPPGAFRTFCTYYFVFCCMKKNTNASSQLDKINRCDLIGARCAWDLDHARYILLLILYVVNVRTGIIVKTSTFFFSFLIFCVLSVFFSVNLRCSFVSLCARLLLSIFCTCFSSLCRSWSAKPNDLRKTRLGGTCSRSWRPRAICTGTS